MTNIIDSVSLIPYLHSEDKPFYLSLFSGQPNNYVSSTAPSVFSVISDEGAFTKVFGAELKTDSGRAIHPLLAFLQKDFYPTTDEVPASCNNAWIDKRWQEIFSLYSGGEASIEAIFLKNQITDSGVCLPFQPLFYCHWKNVYFPPVCPYCKHPMQLCRDEALLAAKGLKAYSETLKRYLFCLQCAQSGETDNFYVSVKEPDDPALVLDKADLIKKAGRCNNGGGSSGNSFFPCLTCDQHQSCYGPENLALARISVFSFYPFYMLLFNADKMNSRDYKKMVSGELFTQSKAVSGATEESISIVLKRILHRWQEEMIMPADSSRENAPSSDLAATRIISAKRAETGNPPKPEIAADNREMEKTVIISKKQASSQAGFDQNKTDLEKTIIIAPGKAGTKDK